MDIEKSLALNKREVISLVGAGGKTTVMFALGRAFSASRAGIVLTTTTKIWSPAPSPSYKVLLADHLSDIRKLVEQNVPRCSSIVLGCRILENGKLQGIPPEWVGPVWCLESVSTIIIEADGAAGRPLKAPRPGEPVWAPQTTVALPIVGVDALGAPLDEENVFRSEIAADILRQPAGIAVTDPMVVRLMAEVLKTRPEGARVVPLINKVDLPGGLEKGRRLAQTLLKAPEIGADRVILAEARSDDIVREVVERA